MKLYELFLKIAKSQSKGINNNIDIVYNELIRNTYLYSKQPLIVSGREEYSDKYKYKIKNIELNKDSWYTYDYCGHSNDWIITEHKELTSVKKYILEQSNNMFTTELFIFKGLEEFSYIIANNTVILERINII